VSCLLVGSMFAHAMERLVGHFCRLYNCLFDGTFDGTLKFFSMFRFVAHVQ